MVCEAEGMGMSWGIRYDTQKEWTWWRWRFKYEKRAKDSPMGRFGGGWQFKLGVQVGSTTWIWSLGHSYLRIERIKR